MSKAELFAVYQHSLVCKKWFHGKRCIEQGLVDVKFYELIKGETE